MTKLLKWERRQVIHLGHHWIYIGMYKGHSIFSCYEIKNDKIKAQWQLRVIARLKLGADENQFMRRYKTLTRCKNFAENNLPKVLKRLHSMVYYNIEEAKKL